MVFQCRERQVALAAGIVSLLRVKSDPIIGSEVGVDVEVKREVVESRFGRGHDAVTFRDINLGPLGNAAGSGDPPRVAG